VQHPDSPSQTSRWLTPAAALSIAAGLYGAWALSAGSFAVGWLALATSVAVLRLAGPRPSSQGNLAGEPDPATTRFLLAVVCAVAVFFRTYRIDPPGLWGDDAINGLIAFDVLDGKVRSPFEVVRHAHSYFHALTNFLIAGSFRLFGSGPTALRLPGILAGILCTPLLYGVFAPLFGARVALTASFLFACSPLQVNHAKTLAQVVLGEFSLLLGLCLFVRGLVGRRPWLAWLCASTPTTPPGSRRSSRSASASHRS
jgi:predicted membrane-bound mannosyltransferase